MAKKIGLYGGTFDPIHCAHLILAGEALEKFELDEIVFVPALVSPHKRDQQSAPAEARLEMLRGAIAGEPHFAVDELDLHRAPPSYTIDTVEDFARRQPAAQLFYLIGSDNLPKLETWHRIAELRRRVQFLVLERSASAVRSEFPTVHRPIGISATEIRKRVASGRSIRYLVPPAVEEIIHRRQLYQEPARSLPKN